MTREEHILTIIAEEAVEIAKNATKALRFGVVDSEPGHEETNAERLLIELADLMGAFEMLLEENDDFKAAYEKINPQREALVQAKIAKVEKLLLYSKSHGRLTESASPVQSSPETQPASSDGSAVQASTQV